MNFTVSSVVSFDRDSLQVNFIYFSREDHVCSVPTYEPREIDMAHGLIAHLSHLMVARSSLIYDTPTRNIDLIDYFGVCFCKKLFILSQPVPIYLSISVPIYLSIYLILFISIYLSISVSIYLSIYLILFISIYLSIYPSIYLCSYLSIYLILLIFIYLSI